jgi:hypothetical protein
MDCNSFGKDRAAVRCIADGFRANTTLQVLSLSFCDLGDHGLSILADSLGKQKRGLVNLNLSANYITCSGLCALVDNATATLSTVTHLDLSHNSIFDDGATFLAEILRLQRLPSLKSLRLIDCGISDDGFVALVTALEVNDFLETIVLENNVFGDQGFLALASSLPNIKGLRQIDLSLLSSNPVFVPALLEGFRNNTSLHEVNIDTLLHEVNIETILHEDNIDGYYADAKWLQKLSFFLYRNKFSRLLQDSDTDDRESLGLWYRALVRVATRPDVLFHVLTSKAGLIRATEAQAQL